MAVDAMRSCKGRGTRTIVGRAGRVLITVPITCSSRAHHGAHAIPARFSCLYSACGCVLGSPKDVVAITRLYNQTDIYRLMSRGVARHSANACRPCAIYAYVALGLRPFRISPRATQTCNERQRQSFPVGPHHADARPMQVTTYMPCARGPRDATYMRGCWFVPALVLVYVFSEPAVFSFTRCC